MRPRQIELNEIRASILASGLVLLACCRGEEGAPDAGAAGDARARDVGTTTDADTTADAAASIDAGAGCDETGRTSTSTDAGLSVLHRNGQSFVIWRDRAEGEEGASIRYRVYRSERPITATSDLDDAELVGVALNNSARLFGYGFDETRRLDPSLPMTPLEEGGEPLPLWSGLFVATATKNACAYYAVLATDPNGNPIEEIEAGINATTQPVAETVAERVPIKVYDSNERERYVEQTRITGTPGLPLRLILHASSARGGPVPGGHVGDYWLYFADRSMGYQDGMPGIFSVQENHAGPPYLMMRSRDTIVRPEGTPMETHWFGYVSDTPNGRHAYPFTERRLDWLVPWVVNHYRVDPNRVYVMGGSMGAWGTMTYAFRRPERFAAVYPNRPRFRQTSLSNVTSDRSDIDTLTLPDGQLWSEHHDSIRFVREHPGDLPFLGWNVGRRDGYATWQEQVDMVAALTEGRHGFAFAWNNGDHSSGKASGDEIQRWYPPSLFSLNESYPAFSHSSIDDDLGSGDPADGDLEGGINLGFRWRLLEDTPNRWVVELSNELAEDVMTVDVTPRRLQRFHPAPGTSVHYTLTSSGNPLRSGMVSVDSDGLVTVESVELRAGEFRTLTLSTP